MCIVASIVFMLAIIAHSWHIASTNERKRSQMDALSHQIANPVMAPDTEAMGIFLEITGAQIAAARGLLRLDQQELADLVNVSVSTLRRMEKVDGAPKITNNYAAVARYLSERVIFIDADERGGPGVRLRNP